MLPPDNHVHSEWSYDTRTASMEQACERAVAIGLPAVAFTEHVDFTVWGQGDLAAAEGLIVERTPDARPLDLTGYQASLERCRARYPKLRIVSGLEAGEPHLFTASLMTVLGAAPFDRVLGSLHGVPHEGRLIVVDTAFGTLPADEIGRRYFAELLRLVQGSDLFEVLAHVDYPRRYWPDAPAYDELAFQEEYRAVFRALAGSGRVLEVNTLTPLASTTLVRWWYEEGGAAVSFGSDAHRPHRVGERFDLAVDVVEAAGFRAGSDRFDFWRR